jgi:hypothetical protein
MSEIKRLLEQIERSYEAAQRALTSPSIMAPHEFIQKRMEEIELAREKISVIVGNEFMATDMVVRRLAALEEKRP